MGPAQKLPRQLESKVKGEKERGAGEKMGQKGNACGGEAEGKGEKTG
jgi:hypothetical protein